MKLSAASMPVRAKRVAVVLCIGAAFAMNAALTWQRWGDPIIDSGREMDTPKQLAAGKLLYRDVRYWYGPLAPYVHAGLYRVFGAKLEVLTTAGLCLSGLLASVSYRLLRLYAGRVSSAVGAIAVLTMNAFGAYGFPNIFNFVLPYSFPAVYGTVISLASVYFLARHLRNGRGSDFAIAAILLGLAALCKLETLAALLAAHAVFAIAIVRRPRLSRSRYALGYATAAAIPAATYLYFRLRAGPGLWSDNLFIAGNVKMSAFILRHSGLEQPLGSLREVAKSFVELGACLAAGFIGERIARDESGWKRLVPAVVAMGAACIVSLGVPAANVLSGLPVVLAIAGGAILFTRVTEPALRARRIELLVLLAWALTSVLRLGLRCSAAHYGFYLGIPAVLGLVVIACGVIPRLGSRTASCSALAAGIALIAALTVQHALRRQSLLADRYKRPDAQLVEGRRGSMIVADPPYLGSVDLAVRYLSRLPTETRVAVLPEGSGMTFLAGCQNALGMHTFLPIDLSGGYDEAGVLSRLAADPPEYILITSRDLKEYGARHFGEDYAQTLVAWMTEHYEIAETFATRVYGVRILRRVTSTPGGRS